MKITLKTFLTFGLLFAIISNANAVTATPKITAINVTPTSAPAGTMFKFSATLNSPLASGNKVKIDLGKGLASMTGTKTSYSLSRAIYTTGAQTYKVGIYNGKNVLQDVVQIGNYDVMPAGVPVLLNHAPVLLKVGIEGDLSKNNTYIVTLKASDSDGNLKTITMNWGDNTTPQKLTAKDNVNLVFTHTYKKTGTFSLNAYATDAKLLSGTKLDIAEIDIQSPTKYTKICNSGALAGEEDCPIEPVLGNESTDWACTLDNDTGLIWEVKTDDGGLRDKDLLYSWYEPDADKNGGDAGYPNLDKNTYSYKSSVNQKGLCGASDWRMPTVEELKGLVKRGTSPTINTAYFPNTISYLFRSSLYNGFMDFSYGSAPSVWLSDRDYYLRLVR